VCLYHSKTLADKLDNVDGCYFGSEYTCGAVLFFGVLAWLAVSVFIVTHGMWYINEKYGLSLKTEKVGFMVLTVIWIIVGFITAIGSPKVGRTNFGNVVTAFSWMNAIAHGLSAALAHTEMQQEEE